jgi:hypothetical protein
MIKGIFYVLKGIFIWACFCYLPFGLVIILKICDQHVFDQVLFGLFITILLISIVVVDKQFKKT